MKALLKEASEVGHIPMRRTLTYASALALNQNEPDAALDILGSCKQQNYVTVRNLKAQAFALLGRMDNTMALLRGVLEFDGPQDRKRSFTKDVVSSSSLFKSLSFLFSIFFLFLD